MIYIIKENRTYDQVFGDMPRGDGDSSLTYFPRANSPNHHALADRFGLFDRFFVNAEVSADGHNWSTAAYATDYTEKTTQQNYSGRGRTFDYQGTNRNQRPAPGEDAAEPAMGYLWDLAMRRGITFRNFGEFAEPEGDGDERKWEGLKPFLEANTDPEFPGWDLDIPGPEADRRLAQTAGGVGEKPERCRRCSSWCCRTITPPVDEPGRSHPAPTWRTMTWPWAAWWKDSRTAGSGAPRSSLSWRTMPRTVPITSTPIARCWWPCRPGTNAGVWHRFVNTSDVMMTIGEILGLGKLSAVRCVRPADPGDLRQLRPI